VRLSTTTKVRVRNESNEKTIIYLYGFCGFYFEFGRCKWQLWMDGAMGPATVRGVQAGRWGGYNRLANR
jgi:hypothetical protein